MLEQALTWLVNTRVEYSANNDVWLLQQHWELELPLIRQRLRDGSYKFEALQIYEFPDKTLSIFSARDSLVLKAMSLVMGEYLQDKLPKECVHVKNHGGLKQTVQQVWDQLPDYKYTLKSDIRGYYASIDHACLMKEIKKLIPDQHVITLIDKSLQRIETRGGLFYDRSDVGIALASPLSPLLAAIALIPLDEAFANNPQVFYRRFMDDYIVLTKTRGQLKKAVRKMWQILQPLSLTIAINKTYIGKIQAGFTFLGYSFEQNQFTVANQTILKHLLKKRKLYEQGASKDALVIFQKQFITWCVSGVKLLCYPSIPNPSHGSPLTDQGHNRV